MKVCQGPLKLTLIFGMTQFGKMSYHEFLRQLSFDVFKYVPIIKYVDNLGTIFYV